MSMSGDSVPGTYPFTRRHTQSSRGRTAFLGQVPFFEKVLEASACLLIVVDAAESAQPIVYASPAFQRLSGYPMTELMGHPWAALVDSESALNNTPGMLRIRSRDQTPLFFDAQVTRLC